MSCPSVLPTGIASTRTSSDAISRPPFVIGVRSVSTCRPITFVQKRRERSRSSVTTPMWLRRVNTPSPW